MLIFAFTQIFFSLVYEFDSKTPLQSVHQYIHRNAMFGLCVENRVSVSPSVKIQKGGKYHSRALMSCCTHRLTTSSKKWILILYKECKTLTEVKKYLIHMSGSQIQLSELKQLAPTCCFNSETYFQLISCINHESRAMCFTMKTVFQSWSVIQVETPKIKQEWLNITSMILVFSMTNSCIDYYTFTRCQFSFGYCCLKQEKACSSGHRFLLWMCPGRKALASTVTLKFVYIHSENSG